MVNAIVGQSIRDFVRRHPAELAGGAVRPTPAGFFDAGRGLDLMRAQERMTERRYQRDRDRFGRADYWAADFGGDCEDRALAAHQWLAFRGWPRSAMRIVLAEAPIGARWQMHAFLEIQVTLSDGEVLAVALDNTRSSPVRSEDLPYRRREIVDPARFQEAS